MAALLLEYVRARFAPAAKRSLAQAPPMLVVCEKGVCEKRFWVGRGKDGWLTLLRRL